MQKQNKNLLEEAVSLFQRIQQRRSELQRELGEIDHALSQFGGATAEPAKPKAISVGRRGRGTNAMPLREAVIKAVSNRPLDRGEILQAVQALGYRFNGKFPGKSLDVFLYGTGKHLFKRVDGKFSLASGVTPSTNGAGKPTKVKRKMSAAGRARIAAAAKARWAKVKAAKAK